MRNGKFGIGFLVPISLYSNITFLKQWIKKILPFIIGDKI